MSYIEIGLKHGGLETPPYKPAFFYSDFSTSTMSVMSAG